MQHSLQHLSLTLSQVSKINRQSIHNFVKNDGFEYGVKCRWLARQRLWPVRKRLSKDRDCERRGRPRSNSGCRIAGSVIVHCFHSSRRPVTMSTAQKPDPKFTYDLRTILRQFSDLRQSYDNWRIHRTFTTISRPILRQHLTIAF